MRAPLTGPLESLRVLRALGHCERLRFPNHRNRLESPRFLRFLNRCDILMLALVSLCAALVLAPAPVSAQWTPGGVNLGGYELIGQDAVSDDAGGVIVGWIDRRDGPYPNLFDLYAQRWNSSGVEQWDIGGAPVCSLASNVAEAVVVKDGAGGAIFAWIDSRTTGSGSGIYVQHVNAAGTHVWTYQGVYATSGGQFMGILDAAADGLGGIVMVWQDYRSGSQQVYAQRVDAAGIPQWPGDVDVANDGDTDDNYSAKLLETLDGGAIVAWVKEEPFPGTSRDIYAQRLDMNGVRLWNAGAGVAVCDTLQSQSNPVIVSDGAGGAVIVWEDRRFGEDIYAQRVNGSGVLQWAHQGVVVCDFDYTQAFPVACSDGTGGAIVAWNDERDTGSGGGVAPRAPGGNITRITEPDIYMQRIDGTGTAQWTANGIAVSTAPYSQAPGQIISDEAGGAVFAWTDDSDNDTNEDVILQRYDSSGNEVWASGGVVHATGIGGRQIFGMVGDGANTIPVWTTFIETAASGEAEASSPGRIQYDRGDGDPMSKRVRITTVSATAAIAASNSIYVQRVSNADGGCTCGPTSAGPVYAVKPLTLSEVVPNPSTGAVEMQLFLENENDVSVEVFDVRGRRVSTQRVGHVARGWRALRFDGRALPSGVYFYRVTAGLESATRKIVIQR